MCPAASLGYAIFLLSFFLNMAWIEITEAKVKAAMSSPEIEALKLAAIAAGQNPLAEIIATAVQEARAHIADCKTNSLAAGSTVPERVEHHLVAIIRYRMLTRVDLEASEDRRVEYREAIRFFQRVSECKVSIEQPTGAVDTSSSESQTETLSSRERIGRAQLGGL